MSLFSELMLDIVYFKQCVPTKLSLSLFNVPFLALSLECHFIFSTQTSATQTVCLRDTHKLTIKHEHIRLNAHQLPVLCKTEKISRINTAIITSASFFFFLTQNYNPFCSSRRGAFVSLRGCVRAVDPVWSAVTWAVVSSAVTP